MTRKPKNGKKFTTLELESIPPDWAGDRLSDGEGLSGLVRLSNDMKISIRFQYVFRLKEKISYYQCGSFPKNSLASIREARDIAREAVKKGLDPREKKKADKINARNVLARTIEDEKKKVENNKTISEMFGAWIKSGVSRKDNNKSIIQSFDKYILPQIGQMPVTQVTDEDLFKIFDETAKAGKKRTADILFKNSRQMFGWAELRQPWRSLMKEGNPARLVDRTVFLKDYKDERDRVLSADELRKLKHVFVKLEQSYLRAENKLFAERPIQKTTQLALWISLSTLCRSGEMLKAEWTHLDFQARNWFIPAINTKKLRKTKQTDHNIYLSDFALSLFQELKCISGHSKWVFPSKNDPNRPVNEKTLSKQVGDRQVKHKNRPRKIKGRTYSNLLVLGDKGWTPHDMRRTGATLMQQLKIDPNVIDKCQHHTINGSKIRKHYLHYHYDDEMKNAWLLLGTEIEKILSSPDTSKNH